ncbi:MAG: sugar phosphate nucleotidyltransferase [Armatimonadota bacterium]
MNQIKKAIIPAAGKSSRHYPASSAIRKELFPLIDQDGMSKAAIQLIVQEAVSAGIEEVCIVTSPGGDEEFKRYFSGLPAESRQTYKLRPEMLAQSEILEELGERLTYVEQTEQLGFGHAVYQARAFAGSDPVLVMLGDHVYVPHGPLSCAKQTLKAWQACGGSVSAIHPISDDQLHSYGILKPSSEGPPWRISEIFEKPDADFAQAHLLVGQLHPEKYLAFFGMHVLQPEIFEVIEHMIRSDIRDRGEYQLTSAQSLLAGRSEYWAAPVCGHGFDLGVPEGLAVTQAALTSLGPFADLARQAASRHTKQDELPKIC